MLSKQPERRMTMLVLKSTRDQMVREAKASAAAAMLEMVSELSKGLKGLGLHPEPRPGETTAAMVVRLINAQRAAAEQFREEVAETRATLRATKSQLDRLTTRGPGGRFVKVEGQSAHH
jgi:hypothetical protein